MALDLFNTLEWGGGGGHKILKTSWGGSSANHPGLDIRTFFQK